MAGWSKNTLVELRALLRSHAQPIGGSKAALVQRLTAFLSDDSGAFSESGDDDVGEEGDGPSASETAELEAAKLQVTRTEAAAGAARAVLHTLSIRHNEQTCQLLQLVG